MLAWKTCTNRSLLNSSSLISNVYQDASLRVGTFFFVINLLIHETNTIRLLHSKFVAVKVTSNQLTAL